MSGRFITGALVLGFALPVAAAAQDDVPRSADGRPDLSGTYDTATLTPLQRPARFGTRGTLTAEEAALVASDPRALRTLFSIAPSGSDERREARIAESGEQEAEGGGAAGRRRRLGRRCRQRRRLQHLLGRSRHRRLPDRR